MISRKMLHYRCTTFTDISDLFIYSAIFVIDSGMALLLHHR